jgi:hypothetical protein
MKIEMSQRWALREHSSKTLCPRIGAEMSVVLRHQAFINVSCLKTNCSVSSGRVIAGVALEAYAQADNNRQAHLVHYLLDCLRCP